VKRNPVTRRLVAVTASAFIGLVGALALAAPVSAHKPLVDGVAECDLATGEYVITWTVANSEDDITGELTAVQADPGGLSTIVVGATLPKEGDGVLSETQRVPGDTTEASLSVRATWMRDKPVVADDGTTLYLDGDCAALAEWGSIVSCDFLVVFVRNHAEQGDATLSLTPNQDATHGHAPGFLPLIDQIDENGFVEVPEDAGLEMTEEVTAGGVVGPLGPFPPGGEHAHGFVASDGLTAQVVITLAGETVVDETVAWDATGLDCEGDDDGGGGGDDDGGGGGDDGGGDDGGGGGDDGDEGLPVTGTSTGIIAGAALALLTFGGGLYLFARRRRISFTA
jgi:LPXTG-motif cell wall-anchored protein